MKAKKLKVGDRVQSHYNAAWTGVVVASGHDHTFQNLGTRYGGPFYQTVTVGRDNQLTKNSPCYELVQPTNVVVKITHDRNGHALRKAIWKVIDSGWLTLL